MFTPIHNRLLIIHNCSLHFHFGSENRHEIVSQANIRCNVVRLCTIMSYDYRCSCRTFIATHVVRHDNLIKTVLRYSCLSFQFLLNVLQMLYDASVHILLVCSIVQLLSIALEVSIETLFDAMKQQYKYSISTYKYRYRTRKQSSSLSSPISCWAIL